MAFQQILVGIDFSESSKAALVEAIRIARGADAHLTVVHVIDRDLADHMKYTAKFSDAEILNQATERLRESVDPEIGCGLDWSCQVLVGYPFEELLYETKRRGVDLLVLGSGGSEGRGDRVGHLARRCVRKVPSKVLLVRERQLKEFDYIVACIDFSETSDTALEFAAQIAHKDGADLHLLHIAPTPIPNYGDMGAFGSGQLFELDPAVQPAADYSEQQKAALDRLVEELIGDRFPGLVIETHVFESGKPGRGITEFLATHEADLVVLGTRGRTGLRSLFIGTTAERIVNHSPCSVLAVKPLGFTYEF